MIEKFWNNYKKSDIMPDWIVENKTYIFGGARVWQPKCNRDVVEILSEIDAVEKPEEFILGGKCFGRHIGKIVGDECTKFLKEDIAFVDTSENLRIGFGHGGLLGGMDKELIFHPVTSGICKKASELDKKRSEMDFFKFGDKVDSNILKSLGYSESQVKDCESREERIEKIDGPIIKELEKCIDTNKLSKSTISGLCKGDINLSVFKESNSLNEILKRGLTKEETIKNELKFWGKNIKDIKRIFHNSETPFLIEMNDKTRIVVAPIIKENECDNIESSIRFRMNKEAENINFEIGSLVD